VPHFVPQPTWTGKNAYIIGGGPSLEKFNWNLLRGVNTIGCNNAFELGDAICGICVFGDKKWFKAFKDELSNYKGLVITPAPRLRNDETPWLHTMLRKPAGLGTHEHLGWNGHTGSLAINLALLLGAQNIFLLGFDMKMGPGKKPNWHEHRHQVAHESVYERFLSGFAALTEDLGTMFPGRQVFNVTDDSDLDAFPKIPLSEHFEDRRTHAA